MCSQRSYLYSKIVKVNRKINDRPWRDTQLEASAWHKKARVNTSEMGKLKGIEKVSI